ncbi:TonB-dependent siderophore receptor [Psittacicella hinzii]|uniref:Uncharacterized protein n=1 Tax=Psittacicella hinzii TaxID=2028575 RepID=A0A3A1YSF3_9GAMM|nr:TonB-dependent siderophore receptor [Psittacicella hinzii]RIY39850.1 hypothetical protein CKF58_01405 [Psittacicella hinzii]
MHRFRFLTTCKLAPLALALFAGNLALANTDSTTNAASATTSTNTTTSTASTIIDATNNTTTNVVNANSSTEVATSTTSVNSNAIPTGKLSDLTVMGMNRSTRTEGRYAFMSSAFSSTTGLNLLYKETPQSISSLTNAYIQARGIYNVEKALNSVTGITVVKESNNYRYLSRGFYIDQIQEDGQSSTIPGAATNPYYSASSFTDFVVYDHIEVVRGATALTLVSNDPSGTINAVYKKPLARPHAQVGFKVNNHGATRLTFDLNSPLADPSWKARLIGAITYDKNQTTAKAGKSAVLYSTVSKDFENDQLVLGAIFQYQRSTPNPYGLPYKYIDGTETNLPRDTYLGAAWNKQSNKKFKLFVEHTHDFNDQWQWLTKVSYTRMKNELAFAALGNSSTRTGVGGVNANGTLALNNKLYYKTLGTTWNVNTGVKGDLDLYGHKAKVYASYIYTDEVSDTSFKRVRDTSAYNIYTFDRYSVVRPDFSTTYDDWGTGYNRLRSHSFSVGGHVELTPQVKLLAGTNYSYFQQISGTDYIWWNGQADSDTDLYTNYGYHALTPLVGLTYEFLPNHTLYTSVGRNFKVQSGKDINDNPIGPKRGTNYEIGYKYNTARVNASIAAFKILDRNRAVSTGLRNANGNIYSVPVGKVRSQGVELEVSGAITDNWQVFAGYTFNTSRYLVDESTTYTAGLNFSKVTPKHILRFYTSYSFAESPWKVGGGFNYQSATSSLYQDITQGGYTLWNFDVSYQVTPKLLVSMNVDNLFNKKYWINNRMRVYVMNNWYGESRTVQLGLDYKF